MAVVVRVKPAPELRREFAVWASERKVRTVSHDEFGVPLPLVPAIPERLLIGARLDSLPYVPSDPRRIPAAPVDDRERVVPLPAGRPVSRVTQEAVARIEAHTAAAAEAPAGGPETDGSAAPEAPAAEPVPATVPGVDADLIAQQMLEDATAPAVPEPAAAPASAAPENELTCVPCGRDFKTPGGKRSHDQQVHGTTSGEGA